MDKNTNQSESRPSPLGGQLPGFSRWLADRGHSESTVKQYRVIGGRFDRYVLQERINVACLAQCHVDSFVEQVEPLRPRGRKDAVAKYYRHACRRFLEYLREKGVISPESRDKPTELAVVTEYLSFLRDHRGLAELTIEDQQRHLHGFLAHAAMTEDVKQLRELSIVQVDRFLVETTGHLKRTSLRHICAALRGFLRYLHMRGVLSLDLSEQVTTPMIYSLEGLPRAIKWEDVERTLAAVDRDSDQGRRDYAILVLLARCGLRRSEVAALRLDDIDWSHDTIRLRRSKCKSIDTVPLTAPVGEALIDYLRCRPESPCPEIFLKVIAPAGPMNRPCISAVARKYLLAAGVKAEHLGSHTLRHSHAVQLLRKGFPLKTIGDTLGHQNPQSTFIYAKATTEDLRSVALEITEVTP